MISTTLDSISQATNPLVQLVSPQSGCKHVGYTIHASYSDMVVMTNDHWRQAAGGIPMNSYLLATSLDHETYGSSDPIDRRAVLLRIVGRNPLASDRDTLRTLMEHFQDFPDTADPALRNMEPISFGMLQWSGISCKVLGTFYLEEGLSLRFGADVEDFFAARQMRVLKPGPQALETIVNFIDPLRFRKAEADARAMGMRRIPKSFQIGHVRFTSASHMGNTDAEVPVRIFPGDFLARRTAVFGMTRTGKSNTTKTMVSAVALSSFETDLRVGQLILDINGEYSNANNQDAGSSIADVFSDNTVRYRAKATPGFRDVRVNFYESFDMGLQFIATNLEAEGASMSEDLRSFVTLDLEEPDRGDHGAHKRWERKVAIYQSILKKAGYQHRDGFRITFDVGQAVLEQIYEETPNIRQAHPDARNRAQRAAATADYYSLQSESRGYSADPEDAIVFWSAVREVEKIKRSSSPPSHLGDGARPWIDDQDYALLCVLVGKSSKSDTPIRGTRSIWNAAKDFHSRQGAANVGSDIYDLLSEGRIVIVDLSVGPPSVRESMAKRITRHIFDRSSAIFTEGGTPPRIVVYVEEAHNLIGKNADLNTTWPRVAKEGAKYGISMVYATQEPSSIHPNILSNTENFFVTHLNNDNEIKALSSYYDFGDFSESLKRCQDVGFARIKTLSSNFTTPTQILLFEPERVRADYDQVKRDCPDWFTPLAEGN